MWKTILNQKSSSSPYLNRQIHILVYLNNKKKPIFSKLKLINQKENPLTRYMYVLTLWPLDS